MRQAMHELTVVMDPAHPPAGRLREPSDAERSTLIDWMGAFIAEAGVVADADIAGHVDVRLRLGGLLVWDDGGAVSLVGMQPRVAGVVRIGPVYTPPEHRRRGYAGAAVAQACRRALAEGVERCTLFTDLANPTSNKIYAEVGFRRMSDWEEHVFDPPAESA
jgi:predicted GNAT family acetyltransferase